jgi:hypothetical protein
LLGVPRKLFKEEKGLPRAKEALLVQAIGVCTQQQSKAKWGCGVNIIFFEVDTFMCPSPSLSPLLVQ